jgi:hypothetical protein
MITTNYIEHLDLGVGLLDPLDDFRKKSLCNHLLISIT